MRPLITPALTGSVAVVSLAFVLASSLPAASFVPGRQDRDEPQYTIPVDVDLVVFNVTVTDSRGRQVTGLKAGDFTISEENRPQSIKLFHAEDVPATVGIVIDNSGSMNNKHADVAEAALVFAEASNSGDEIFIINFNEHVSFALPRSIPFTNDMEQIRLALFRAAPTGLTALYDALAAGLEHLKSGTRERKALVVLSDGGDNASTRPLDDMLAMAQRSSATIYTIGIYDETNQDRNPGVLRKIAELSGGRAYFPDSLNDLDEVWSSIAGGIRSQYTIGYVSDNAGRDGAFRKVRITAGRNGDRNLRVTTREGYVGPSDPPVTR